MKLQILAPLFCIFSNIAWAQDKIILRNNDTIHCKLREIDQYYTYFIPNENTEYIMYLKNMHIKLIFNNSLIGFDALTIVSKDTSTYITNRKIQIARYGKLKGNDSTHTTKKTSKSMVEVASDKLSEHINYYSFSTLPFSIGLGVKNESNFQYSNLGNNNFSLSMESIQLNSLGFQAFIGTDQFLYSANYKSTLGSNFSFLKKESSVNFGLGPNFSIKTSQSSFFKLNAVFSASLGSTLSYSDFRQNGTTLEEENAYHEANKTNVRGKLGMDLILSFNKQLIKGLGFSFGFGYKGRKQNYGNSGMQATIYDRQSSTPIKIEDHINYQLEHNLATFLSIGALF